jgi:hypothetical protein
MSKGISSFFILKIMLITENISHEEFKKYLEEFYNYASKKLKLDRRPKIVFKKDKKNAEDMFGKTGYYDPDNELIALYISDRHPKDVLRSFAHELVHHHQKCKGMDKEVDFSKTAHDPAYASHDKGLRKMERQAFRWGNMLFRDWCDMKKIEKKENTMAESKEKKGMPDHPDVDGDGDRDESIKQASKQAKQKGIKPKGKKKKGGKGKIPPQLANYIKSKKKDVKESDTYGEVEAVGSESKQMNECVEHPYPQLFKQKDRLFEERFVKHEELIFNELMRRIIKK